MKKFKIFFSMISLCFAMAVLVFGVFAINQIDFRISGHLNYTVNDAYINIETSVLYSSSYLEESEIYEKIEDIVSESAHGLSTLALETNLDYNSLTDRNAGDNSKSFDIQFEDGEGGRLVYFIKMKVTNIGGNTIWVAANSDIELPDNVYSVNSGVQADIESYDYRILVIALTLEDITINIEDDQQYQISLYCDTITEDKSCPYEFYHYDNDPENYLCVSNFTQDTLYLPSYYNGNKYTFVDRIYDTCTCSTTIVPSSIPTIGHDAFYYCNSLTTVILNKSIKCIHSNAFNSNQLLTSDNGYYVQDKYGDNIALIKVSTSVGSFTIPEETTIIAEYAFDGCEGLTSLTIPDTVLCLSGALSDSSIGLESITIGNGVKKIPNNFLQYSEIDTLVLSEGLESIGDAAFFSCKNLTSVIIPSTVTFIGGEAFWECDNFESVIMLSSIPCELEISRWKVGKKTYTGYRNFRSTTTIYVPVGSLLAYQNATGWSDFTIEENV